MQIFLKMPYDSKSCFYIREKIAPVVKGFGQIGFSEYNWGV